MKHIFRSNLYELLTSKDFFVSLEKLKHPLSLPESEESWEEISTGLERLRRLCQLGACDHGTEIIFTFRSLHRNIVSAMNSERTRLSGAALDALGEVALSLGSDFEPILPLFFPALLSLCGRMNKVVVSRAKTCVFGIIEATQLPGILTYLVQSVNDKSPTIRLAVAEGALSCLRCFNPPDLEKESLAFAIETIIRSTVRDANANIRKVGKDVFQSFKVVLPHRVERYVLPLFYNIFH
jgi:CLIP-associating protein 1/2